VLTTEDIHEDSGLLPNTKHQRWSRLQCSK